MGRADGRRSSNGYGRARAACAFLVLLLAACGDAPGGGPGAAVASRDGGRAADAPDTPSPDAPSPETPSTGAGLPAVAITVDDLPWVGPLPPGWSRMDGIERVIAALEAHGAPAAGFANCARAGTGAPVLRRWHEAGHRLGNHTASHPDLNRTDPAEWAADARSCDAFLRELTGETAVPFRYPYLHRGSTPERYRAGRAAVEAMGGAIAPVTIDTGDWIVDDAYVAALRAGDEERAETIARAYLDHVVRASRHYREVARERLGRDVAHVLLLHANGILADRLDALLTRLEAEGFRFVTLEAALEDPVYVLEDDYVGPDGLSCLYRIPPATPEAARWDRLEAEALRELVGGG